VVDKERVTRLLSRVRADTRELRTFADADRKDLLSDRTAMGAVKYLFLTAIEGCARVAHHLIASEGWGAPDTNAAAFQQLSDRGVVTATVGAALADAARFRNVLVHQYAEVDDNRVVTHLDELDDLDEFVTEVAAWIEAAED
jgi:uncharacterized protein YutE (UPF0331/DUF86 family)